MSNFKNYSLQELYDSLKTIDKDKWPDRVKEIKEIILEKERKLNL